MVELDIIWAVMKFGVRGCKLAVAVMHGTVGGIIRKKEGNEEEKEKKCKRLRRGEMTWANRKGWKTKVVKSGQFASLIKSVARVQLWLGRLIVKAGRFCIDAVATVLLYCVT